MVFYMFAFLFLHPVEHSGLREWGRRRKGGEEKKRKRHFSTRLDVLSLLFFSENNNNNDVSAWKWDENGTEM